MSENEEVVSLDRLAGEVRYLYYDVRREWLLARGRPADQLPGPNPTWDGGEDRFGRRHASIWRKVAAFLLEHELDPRVLVRAVFDRAAGGDPPLPTALAGRNVLSLMAGFRSREVKLVRADVAAEKQMVASFIVLAQHAGTSDQETWRKAVLHPDLDNELVRYVLALSCGQLDLAEGCKPMALREYLRHPGPYDEVLGSELPPSFREDALRLKGLLLGFSS